MGLMDKLRGEFIDIIEWLDDSRDTIVWRFPRYDNEIKMGAKLVVRESQTAVFVNEGQVADVVHARHLHAADPEHADPVHAQGLEVRLRLAVEGRGLLRQHPAVHRHEVGHAEPGHRPRPRVRHGPAAGVRRLRAAGHRPGQAAARAGRHRPAVPHRGGAGVPAADDRQPARQRAGHRAACRCSTSPPSSRRIGSQLAARAHRASSPTSASRSRSSSSRTSRCRRRSRRPWTSAPRWACSATWTSTPSSRPPTRWRTPPTTPAAPARASASASGMAAGPADGPGSVRTEQPAAARSAAAGAAGRSAGPPPLPAAGPVVRSASAASSRARSTSTRPRRAGPRRARSPAATLVWQNGMAAWTPPGEVPELAPCSARSRRRCRRPDAAPTRSRRPPRPASRQSPKMTEPAPVPRRSPTPATAAGRRPSGQPDVPLLQLRRPAGVRARARRRCSARTAGTPQDVAGGRTAAIEEHAYDAFAGLPPQAACAALGAHRLTCHGCGAQTESDDLSDRCQFCGAPLVAEIGRGDQIAPEAVLPFGSTGRAAQDAVGSVGAFALVRARTR